MARIRGQKQRGKTQEKDDLNAPLPSSRVSSINPSSVSESDWWWENFSTRFSGYTPDCLFKLSRKTFEYICGLVEEEMMTGTNYTDLRREYLILNDRVAIALTRLCTGESFEAIGNLFGVSIPMAYQITWRFVEAIEKIGFHHLHWPETEEQMTEIKSKFEGIRGLPNCCGAIDTTKIMFCLSSDHAQRKIWCDPENNPCMILQAIVDPDMRFLDIIAGLPGCLSKPDALYEWSFFNLCEEGKRLNGKKLAENKEEIGEYIVGNGGFPLLPWLLTPYDEEKKLSDVQEDFNKRLYETWKVAKMAFERLKETWKIIQGVLWIPDKLKLPRIIYACCVLHNIMIDQNDGFKMQDESFLHSDDNIPQSHQENCKFLNKTASVHRDNLALYLSSKPHPFSSNGIETVACVTGKIAQRRATVVESPRVVVPLNVAPLSAIAPEQVEDTAEIPGSGPSVTPRAVHVTDESSVRPPPSGDLDVILGDLPPVRTQPSVENTELTARKRQRGESTNPAESDDMKVPEESMTLNERTEEEIWKMAEILHRQLKSRVAESMLESQRTIRNLWTSRKKYKDSAVELTQKLADLKLEREKEKELLRTVEEQRDEEKKARIKVEEDLKKEQTALADLNKSLEEKIKKEVHAAHAEAVRQFLRGPMIIELLEVLLTPLLCEGYTMGVDDALQSYEGRIFDPSTLPNGTLYSPVEMGEYDRRLKELQAGVDVVHKYNKPFGDAAKKSDKTPPS